jgi:hypothetical protein
VARENTKTQKMSDTKVTEPSVVRSVRNKQTNKRILCCKGRKYRGSMGRKGGVGLRCLKQKAANHWTKRGKFVL